MVLAQHEVKSQYLSPQPIGDETRVLSGPVEGGDDTTLYVRTGALLLRLSLTTTSGAPGMSPQRIAQGIVDRATAQSPSSALTVMQSAAEPLLDTLPLDHAACFSVAGEGELDVPTVVERLAAGADASASSGSRLAGWRLPPIHLQAARGPGRLGRYQRPSLPRRRIGERGRRLFRGIAGRQHGLQTVPAPTIGDSSAALTGPAVNGTEYSLYLSGGRCSTPSQGSRPIPAAIPARTSKPSPWPTGIEWTRPGARASYRHASHPCR